jgi:hypothetical protein
MVKKTPTTPLKKGRFNIDSVQYLIPEIEDCDPPNSDRRKLSKAITDTHHELANDAEHWVSLYWNVNRHHKTTLSDMHDRLASKPILDPWQIIHLIEAAGNEALKRGYSKHKSQIASAKNKEPKEWVQGEWAKVEDKRGKKASFAREHSNLVQKKFNLTVTADQIAKVWLKGMW